MSESKLIEAVKAKDLNKLQTLLENGEDTEQQDDYGWTALNWAAGCGDIAIVRCLLEAGADPGNCGRDLRTPYRIALAAAHPDVAELLQGFEQRTENSEKHARPYCKAYPSSVFEPFPDWRRPDEADGIVYLHQDFTVTASSRHGETVVFDRISEDWRRYCRDRVGFQVPTDLELAADYRAGISEQ